VDGRQVEHWLDGVSVMQADLENGPLRAAMANQRRADIPKPHHLDELHANPAKTYPIVLTHHSGDAWFRSFADSGVAIVLSSFRLQRTSLRNWSGRSASRRWRSVF
jgi:hypothetical protein